MTIFPIALLLIPLGLYLFFRFPEWLPPTAAFFVAFSGTYIVGMTDAKVGVLAFGWFSGLWVLRALGAALTTRLLPLTINGDRTGFWTLAFLLAALVSWIWPLTNPDVEHFYSFNVAVIVPVPIRMSLLHILEFSYIFVGAVFTLFTGLWASEKSERIQNLATGYLLGSAIAAAIGLVEFVSLQAGRALPLGLLNNLSVPTESMTLARLAGDELVRIRSVADEPSVFAIHMMTAFAFASFMLLNHWPGVPRWLARIAMVSCGLAGLLAISSTGFFGIAVFFVAGFVLLAVQRRLSLRIIRAGIVFGVLAALAGVVFLGTQAQYILQTFVFGKLGSGSAMIRLYTIYQAAQLGLRHPFIGVGWGVVASPDLIIKIFSGAGVLGLVTFMGLILHAFRRLKIMHGLQARFRSQIPIFLKHMPFDGLAVALLVLLAMYVVSGFQYRMGDLWVLLAQCLGTGIALSSQVPVIDKAPADAAVADATPSK